LSGFDLGHGQSVAIGMMVAARVSRLMGCCDDNVVDLHKEVLQKYKLRTMIPSELEVDAIVEMMRYNKRYLVEGTRFALVGEPGRLRQIEGQFAVPVPNQILAEALRATLGPHQ
jgi:3-dehydroquinate synthase